jgi:4-hydroxy-3-polyprenylbenzoate decarboxylase
MPKSVRGHGACQQIIHRRPDLTLLPVLKCWPADGGRFITLPTVHTIHPETGARNIGMYRIQILDRQTAAMHWHLHKTGAQHLRAYRRMHRLMPVAVAIGGRPASIYAATAPLPEGIDEHILAGYLSRRPIRLVRCLTQNIEVPDDADIILEGYIDPDEPLIDEGPFGDHTGFYSLIDRYPRLHITCITHRRHAVYPATVVGIPPQEDAWIEKASERIFLMPLRLTMLPEIIDMRMPASGVAHNLTLVHIRKNFAGHAQKTIHTLWGAGQMMFNKILIVTDFALNDTRDVLRRILSRIDIHSSLVISRGPLDVLDHSSPTPAFGSKLGIDATHALSGERRASAITGNMPCASVDTAQPFAVTPDAAAYPGVTSWNLSLPAEGIPVIILGIGEPNAAMSARLAEQVMNDESLRTVKVFIFMDDTANIYNLDTVCWLACANIDPERDLRIAPAPRQQMVVDACMKRPQTYDFPRDWPNVVTSDETTIVAVNRLWSRLSIGALLPSPSAGYLSMKFGNGAVAE